MAVSISISITQNSQNVANNKSNVTAKVTATWTGGSHNSVVDASGTPQSKGWLEIDGTQYSFSSTFNTGGTTSGSQTIFTKTVDVVHNSDGTKNLTCSASYSTGVSSGTVTATATKTLTTIPRKSTLNVANGTLGTTQTLTVTRQSTNFTHTITYKCGGASGTICTKSSNASISFTPPISLASENTAGTSVAIDFTITTYNGSTKVESATYTKTYTIPESVKPSVSITVKDPYKFDTLFGGYVQGHSKLEIKINATESYGAEIQTYKTTAGGKSYTTDEIITDYILGSSNITISTTVTDARGRKGTASVTVKVIPYSNPKISSLEVFRSNAAGGAVNDGNYLTTIFNSSVTSIKDSSGNELNQVLYTVRYKKSTDKDYKIITLSDYTNVLTVKNGSCIFAADSGTSYSVVVTVTDAFTSISRSNTGSAEKKVFSILAKGLGLAFGKTAELSDTAEFAFKLLSHHGELIVNPIEIAASTDLDELTTPGYYIIGTDGISGTITNKPLWCKNTTSTAKIYVEKTGNGARIMQKYYDCDKDDAFEFRRLKYSGTWGKWIIASGSTPCKALTVSTGFATYTSSTETMKGSEPQYQVSGNIVSVFGELKPTASIKTSATEIEIAGTIPERFRPGMKMSFLCQGSGSNKWLLSIKTDGNLYMSRYGISSFETINSGTWLPFSVSYPLGHWKDN